MQQSITDIKYGGFPMATSGIDMTVTVCGEDNGKKDIEYLMRCLRSALMSNHKPRGEIVPKAIVMLDAEEKMFYSNSQDRVQPLLLEEAPGKVFLLVYGIIETTAEQELKAFLEKLHKVKPIVHIWLEQEYSLNRVVYAQLNSQH